MKKQIAGIIGGMGPLSSIKFYTDVITYSQDKYHIRKNDEYPHLLISNLPVPDLINDREKEEETKNMIITELKQMEKAGVTFFSIANNTVHLFIEEFRQAVPVPILSIVEETKSEIEKTTTKKLLLLGTPTTIKQRLYQSVFEKTDIQIISPSDEELVFLGKLIPKLVGNTQEKAETEKLNDLIFAYQNCDAVLLACTELFLAIDEKRQTKPIYDAMTLLTRRTARIALHKDPIIV